jgi:hypothetical protein
LEKRNSLSSLGEYEKWSDGCLAKVWFGGMRVLGNR